MNLWQNAQFSFGQMQKSPRVGVTMLLTLALGISANTVVAERRPLTSANNSGTDVDFKSANTALSSLSIGLGLASKQRWIPATIRCRAEAEGCDSRDD